MYETPFLLFVSASSRHRWVSDGEVGNLMMMVLLELETETTKFGEAIDDGALFDEMVGRCSLMALGCGVFGGARLWRLRCRYVDRGRLFFFFPSFFDSSSLLLSAPFLSVVFFFSGSSPNLSLPFPFLFFFSTRWFEELGSESGNGVLGLDVGQ